MIQVCHICSAVIALDTGICVDCDIALKTILPAEERHEINLALHELDEHEGAILYNAHTYGNEHENANVGGCPVCEHREREDRA